MPLTVAAINALIDWRYRGQAAPALPASYYAALLSAVPGPGLPNGTEIVAGGVARVEVPRALAEMSGTQGAGTITASSGATRPGYSSNNNEWEFAAAASADVANAVAIGLFDAAVAGNCLDWAYIVPAFGGAPITRSWTTGQRVAIEVGQARFGAQ